MKFRQTLIWEFMNKKTIKAIDKLVVLERLSSFYILLDSDKWYDSYKRVFVLINKVKEKLTKVQKVYYDSLVNRAYTKDITLSQYAKNYKNFLNYYSS